MTTTRARTVVLVMLGALVAALTLVVSGPAWAAVADLSVRKTASDRSVSVGENFVWRVTVKNSGPAQAQNVRVVDTLPESVRLNNVLASKGGPCDVDFPRVTCTLGNLAAGEKATIKLFVDPTQAGVLRNRVRVNQTGADANASNNRAVSVVRVR